MGQVHAAALALIQGEGPSGCDYSTAFGVKCSGCRLQAPAANANANERPIEVCETDPEYHTRCYWVKAKADKKVSYTINKFKGESGSMQEQRVDQHDEIKKGSKLILYMRLNKQDRKPKEYYCCKCFKKKYPHIMDSVLLGTFQDAHLYFVTENALLKMMN